MTYVVTEACIRCKYMDCVEVCPVDCFYEGENQLQTRRDLNAASQRRREHCEATSDLRSGYARSAGFRPPVHDIVISVLLPISCVFRAPHRVVVAAVAPVRRPTEASPASPAGRLRETDMNSDRPPFATGDLVVYPTHGVGKIVGIETQEISGHTLNVFVVHFDKDRMTLRVPLAKAKASGLRRLSSRKDMDAALAKLRGRSRAKRSMWSRRAQEYQAKIASGDPGSIAEVVRDLYRNAGQPEQSYSERQIYQAALDRFVREFAAVERIDETTATQRVEQLLTA